MPLHQMKISSGDQMIAVADLDPAEVVRVQELNPIARDRLDTQGRRHRVELS